jgi:hypothetical protein
MCKYVSGTQSNWVSCGAALFLFDEHVINFQKKSQIEHSVLKCLVKGPMVPLVKYVPSAA